MAANLAVLLLDADFMLAMSFVDQFVVLGC